ncbi:hypothetical protein GPA10_19230 [Streptomyces sp. p1417]|uniref:Nucleopolyhedrovirus P10 family protein n=1 Tax=Streptomyces typhae TaxID=2681492 RepID=A0A6L6WZ86_9ACTN|nr:hypothetical protein [Streptomyces typhae]MVO86832.1 hypothetical protein [Streptomyces typhae]
MTGDRWTSAVRRQLGLGRVLPLGGPGDGAWLAESAARAVLLGSAGRVTGARVTGLRVGPAAGQDAERHDERHEERVPAKGYAAGVPAPPSALPPGPLRITADFTAGTTEPLPAVAARLRTALGTAAAERLGLEVTEVDLRVTGLSEEAAGGTAADKSERAGGKVTGPVEAPGGPEGPATGHVEGPGSPEGPVTEHVEGPGSPEGPVTEHVEGPGSPEGPVTEHVEGPGSPEGPVTEHVEGPGDPEGPVTEHVEGPGSPEGPVAQGAPPPDSDEDRATRACLAVPGVVRMAGTLGGLGRAVLVTEQPAPHALPRRHVRVELAADAAHRALDVARAVRTAVAGAFPDHPTVAVLITSVERGTATAAPA